MRPLSFGQTRRALYGLKSARQDYFREFFPGYKIVRGSDAAISPLWLQLINADLQVAVFEGPFQDIEIVKAYRLNVDAGAIVMDHKSEQSGARQNLESAQRNPCELALANLDDDDATGFQIEITIRYLFAIEFDSALLDHAKTLRGAGGQSGLLE